jgi:glucosamine 6-phosphate synthetase-like amidotransferase/phosphosugar isomerase protein
MCGVIGLVCERTRDDLGLVAADLLKTLEYRGYDSTGAAIQGETLDVRLAKGVGAPSVMVRELGIVGMAGRVFCGQVRWATFGAVDEANAQPHVVRCKTFLYGAHNGNVTNCDALKAWLTSEGHTVLSDNDGEMVVHTVEHFFARELASLVEETPEARRRAMRAAILKAAAKLEGSFAAVIVDPVTRVLFGIKQGSSFYFGFGSDAVGGHFAIASSDLSSVLKLTRVVVPLSEGELVEYDALGHALYAVVDKPGRAAGAPIAREPVRSRLRAKDTALVPPFETFMDQEIAAQEETCRDVVRLFFGGADASRDLRAFLATRPEAELRAVHAELDHLRDEYEDDAIRGSFHGLVDGAAFQALLRELPSSLAPAGGAAEVAARLVSTEAGLFADLAAMARGPADLCAVLLFDALLEAEDVRDFRTAVDGFGRMCSGALAQGGRIYVVCCGSSQHAARAASLFFNELARVEVIPILPGEFRGQYARSLRDGDIFVAISQSGETKDLIDVMNDVIASGKRIARIALVNNVSSTLAQEKSDLVIPLRCGPEIAVPATKSFMNQMVVLYALALELASVRVGELDEAAAASLARELEVRKDRLRSLPELLRATFESTGPAVERAAELLYLRPSIHLLATRISAIAKEGALKIREVVLNHTEGFEGSEFKHGPNTILGLNTVYGPLEVDALLKRLGHVVGALVGAAGAAGLGLESAARLAQAAADSALSPVAPFSLTAKERALFDRHVDRAGLLSELVTDYPLVYITGPDERDVALTVSQINTHKIRGSCTVVIAEEHPALTGAASKPPADNPDYASVMVTLPRTSDTLMAMFSATVVLQRLALRMSLLKMRYLDQLGVADHGVHPDVPKNVSKSITVD